MWTGHYLMENTQSVLMVFGGVGRKDDPAEAGKDRAEVKAGFKYQYYHWLKKGSLPGLPGI